MTDKTQNFGSTFIAALLRQRMNYEQQFAPGAHRMTVEQPYFSHPFGVPPEGGKHDHRLAVNRQRQIPVFEGELEVLLCGYAEGARNQMQLEADIREEQKRTAAYRRQAKGMSRQLCEEREGAANRRRSDNDAIDLVRRVMVLFSGDGWKVEKQDDQGWMIHSPRVDGMASHNVIWEDSSNPAEALLALLLDEVFPDGKGGDAEP